MNPLVLGPLLEVGKTLLDRFVPDPEKKRESLLCSARSSPICRLPACSSKEATMKIPTVEARAAES